MCALLTLSASIPFSGYFANKHIFTRTVCAKLRACSCRTPINFHTKSIRHALVQFQLWPSTMHAHAHAPAPTPATHTNFPTHRRQTLSCAQKATRFTCHACPFSFAFDVLAGPVITIRINGYMRRSGRGGLRGRVLAQQSFQGCRFEACEQLVNVVCVLLLKYIDTVEFQALNAERQLTNVHQIITI